MGRIASNVAEYSSIRILVSSTIIKTTWDSVDRSDIELVMEIMDLTL